MITAKGHRDEGSKLEFFRTGTRNDPLLSCSRRRKCRKMIIRETRTMTTVIEVIKGGKMSLFSPDPTARMPD